MSIFDAVPLHNRGAHGFDPLPQFPVEIYIISICKCMCTHKMHNTQFLYTVEA